MSVKKYMNQCGKDIVKRICQLKPLEEGYGTISLVSGKSVIGRSKETGIRDSRCSKEQLHLQVDLAVGSIKLKVLGINPCSVNGVMVMRHTECTLQHGDLLEIVYGRHPFEVIFNPAPASGLNASSEKMETEEACPAVARVEDKWSSVDNGKLVVYTSAGVLPSVKIASYDMDGTIIKTKSGNVFPKNTDDWQIIFPEVPNKLQRLHADGFKICFFTNQGGLARGKIKLDDFKKKIKLIVQKLAVPVQVFIAIGDGYQRKPCPGMWEHLTSEMNDGVNIELDRSFFVGDAAGRPETGSGATKQRKDHSLADRLFARNVGISFYTPEVHFLGRRMEPWNKPDFEPASVHDQLPQFDSDNVEISGTQVEMILMMGLPGSGKSHFCKEVLSNYAIINADTLGSVQACLTACKRQLSVGKSCVVDNTNVDAASRQKFIALAKQMAISCRCFVMNVPMAHAKHNIAFRELSDAAHSKINDMVFNMMKKKYKEPTLEEGFTEITKVNFKPKFINDKEEKLYKMYLIDK